MVFSLRVHEFLNARCLTIAGGSEQILLNLAGERLLGLPASPRPLSDPEGAVSSATRRCGE